MALTRSSSGLLLRDDFDSDTEANYTRIGYDGWTIGSGIADYAGGSTPSHLYRPGITTCGCGTTRYQDTNSMADAYTELLVGGSGASGTRPYGYVSQPPDATHMNLYYAHSGGLTQIATAGASLSASTWYYTRIYISGGTRYIRWGTTDLSNSDSASDSTYSAGQVGFKGYSNTTEFDFLEARTSHIITCSGMTENHYLYATDGTTEAESQADGGGDASTDCGALLFPLTEVGIYTGSGATGDQIATLGTGDYADMGGGDVFAYEGEGGGLSIPVAMHHYRSMRG